MTLCNWCGNLLNFTEKYSCTTCKQNQVKMCNLCKRPFNDIRYFSNPEDNCCTSCNLSRSSKKQKFRKEQNEFILKNIYSHLTNQVDKKDFILSKPEKGKKQTLITDFLEEPFKQNTLSLVSKISTSQVTPVKQPRKMTTNKEQRKGINEMLQHYQSEKIPGFSKQQAAKIQSVFNKLNKTQGGETAEEKKTSPNEEGGDDENPFLKSSRQASGKKRKPQTPKTKEEIDEAKKKKAMFSLAEAMINLPSVAPDLKFNFFFSSSNNVYPPQKYITNFNSFQHGIAAANDQKMETIHEEEEEQEEDEDEEDEAEPENDGEREIKQQKKKKTKKMIDNLAADIFADDEATSGDDTDTSTIAQSGDGKKKKKMERPWLVPVCSFPQPEEIMLIAAKQGDGNVDFSNTLHGFYNGPRDFIKFVIRAKLQKCASIPLQCNFISITAAEKIVEGLVKEPMDTKWPRYFSIAKHTIDPIYPVLEQETLEDFVRRCTDEKMQKRYISEFPEIFSPESFQRISPKAYDKLSKMVAPGTTSVEPSFPAERGNLRLKIKLPKNNINNNNNINDELKTPPPLPAGSPPAAPPPPPVPFPDTEPLLF